MLEKNEEALLRLAKQGNVERVLEQLNDEDAQKVRKLLSDKEATEKLMNSPQAKKLMEKLFGGKK